MIAYSTHAQRCVSRPGHFGLLKKSILHKAWLEEGELKALNI